HPEFSEEGGSERDGYHRGVRETEGRERQFSAESHGRPEGDDGEPVHSADCGGTSRQRRNAQFRSRPRVGSAGVHLSSRQQPESRRGTESVVWVTRYGIQTGRRSHGLWINI